MTNTKKLHMASLLELSTAEQRTSFCPRGKYVVIADEQLVTGNKPELSDTSVRFHRWNAVELPILVKSVTFDGH